MVMRATVALVNNAQREHQEFMASVQAVAEENGFDFTAWLALVAPQGLPPDVKQRLVKALETVLASADTQEAMRKAGFEPQWAPVPDWAGTVNKDIARMKAVADKAQIKLE